MRPASVIINKIVADNDHRNGSIAERLMRMDDDDRQPIGESVYGDEVKHLYADETTLATLRRLAQARHDAGDNREALVLAGQARVIAGIIQSEQVIA